MTSLAVEGAAMLSAVVEDFARLNGVSVATIVESKSSVAFQGPVDCRGVQSPSVRDKIFDCLAEESDATIVIAPEFDGVLLALVQRVASLGGRLLSPGPEFVEIASDKQETVDRLHLAGVRVPRGGVVMPGERCPAGFEYPAVLKPIDGAGSMAVEVVQESSLVPSSSGAYRLEEFVAGQPASVAFLCGPNECAPLEPCTQRLSGGNDFSYLGGKLPLGVDHRQRALELAASAIGAMPTTAGYVGIDLVLGDADDGSQDAVIEINPRYTTSYVGLRAATGANLADLCLAVSNGDSSPRPTFDQAVEWDAADHVKNT